MIAFPHAKINLGLNVVRKRLDGYHDIQSVLVPIPLFDVLEVIEDPTVRSGGVVLTRSGLVIPGDAGDDLCAKAYHLLSEHRQLPGVRMHLHKTIPIGAGLGGGSSDGAHALRILDRLFELGLSATELAGMASQLGSDCPFFLNNVPQLAQGRGEQLTPIGLDLSGWWILLVNPGIHVSTAAIYASTMPTNRPLDLASTLSRFPVELWQDNVVNSMENAAFHRYPVISHLKSDIFAHGAVYAAMSGSGSSVFGLFKTPPPDIGAPKELSSWRVKIP